MRPIPTLKNEPKELCYCCGLPMLQGQPSYTLSDEEGLVFYAHKECAERDMELVKGKP